MEPKVLKTFKCPHFMCVIRRFFFFWRKEQIMSRMAIDIGEVSVPENAKYALRVNQPTPLVQPGKLAGLTVPAVMSFFDICADCGTEFCSRVELQHLPFNVQAPQMPQQLHRK